MSKLLTFSIDTINLIHEVSDSQLAVAEIYVCHDGNNLHNKPISLETLKNAEHTLINKFLVAGFDGNDFMNHELDQKIVGFFPKENNFKYIEKNGKTYLVANAIISKIYADWAYDIFLKDNYRSCSMEITVLETEKLIDGKEQIKSFVFNGVTLLSKKAQEACVGSNAQIQKFSKDEIIENGEKVYKEYLKFEYIEIDNSKDSATNGKWSNPGSRLYKPILSSQNKNELIKEAYLIHESGYENAPSVKLKYPHHIIKNGKLVLHISGLQSALQRAKQQNLDGEPIQHLKSHYKQLGLNQDNFSVFGITQDEYFTFFKDGEKMENQEALEQPVEMSDDANTESVAQAELNEEETEDNEEIIQEDNENNESDNNEEISDSTQEEQEAQYEINYQAMYEDMCNKMAELEEKMSVYMSENEELKKFKAEKEQAEKMAAVEFALSEVIDVFTSDKIQELRDKVDSFNNINDWSNYVKAEAFSLTKNNTKKESYIKIGLPHTQDVKKSNSVWDRLG